MLNSRFGYSVKKNSFKGLNIDCIQYSNIIRISHYSYSYSGTILNPNIICIRIRPNICAQILFVFVFGQNSDSEYYLYSYSVQKTVFAHLCFRDKSQQVCVNLQNQLLNFILLLYFYFNFEKNVLFSEEKKITELTKFVSLL